MKRLLGCSALVVLTLACLAGAAQAQGVDLVSKQKVVATLDEPYRLHVYRFQAVEGDLLTLLVSPSKKTRLVPEVSFFGPEGPIALPPLTKGKLNAKKLPLPATGLYFVGIGGAGTVGDYKLSLKLKGAKIEPRTVAVPGDLTFDAPRGALLTAKVQAEKGSDLEPGVDSITGPAGDDVLDPEKVAEKAGTAKVRKLQCSVFGEHTMSLAVRSGQAGNAVVKLKLKPAKPALRKLGPDELVETGLFKVRNDAGECAMMVWAFEAAAATLRYPPASGKADVDLVGGNGEFAIEEGFTGEAELDAAYPDGHYTLVVTLLGGEQMEVPFHVEGMFPEAVTGVDVGPPVTWSGGTGAQMIHVGVDDEFADDEFYEALVPASEQSHALPDDLLPPEIPVSVEVAALSPGMKLSISMAARAGVPVTYNAALSVGDLLTYTLDFNTRRYDYEFLEGVYAGQTGAGDLVPVHDRGRYVFEAVDDGEMPSEAATLVMLPGRLLVGKDADFGLFAGVPARADPYPVAEVQGIYNYMHLTCADYGSFTLCDPELGTVEIADGTWRAWPGSDAVGTASESGTWTDQGNGIVHVFSGLDRAANAMVLPGPEGGEVLIMDFLDGGLLLGVRQRKVTPGELDGAYDVLITMVDDLVGYEFSGRYVVMNEFETEQIRFNQPWTGFVMGGDQKNGGAGLITPSGIMLLSSWGTDKGPPPVRMGFVGAGVRR